MGKRKKEGAGAEFKDDNAQPDPAPQSKKLKNETQGLKKTEKPKKPNSSPAKIKQEMNSLKRTKENTNLTASSNVVKNVKVENQYTDSSSSSDSESEKNSNINYKKSASESNSDSDSDSSGSDSSPPSKTSDDKKGKVKMEMAKNCVTNYSPVKSYNPPPKSSSSDSYHSDTEEEDKKRRKKQKKLLKMQLNKKAKKLTVPKREPNLDTYEDLDIKDDSDDDGNGNLATANDDIPDWSESDFTELIKRIRAQIPPKDNRKYDSTVAKLDWNKIAFGDYTAAECLDVWTKISKRIRKFRFLSEMLEDAKEWVRRPWTNFYKPKKTRHPDMPTRPLSTYMIYYLEHKDEVAKENPGLEMTQVSKIIAEKYKNLSQEERDRYTEMAAKERAKFDEKITEFYKEHPEMVPQSQNKSNVREVTTKGPKKPFSPFKLFLQDQLKAYENLSSVDKKAAEDAAKEKWRNLSDKKKLIWINWAVEDAKRYAEELRVYQMEHPDYMPAKPTKDILNKDERCIKERLAGKPVKPPNSAYSLFSRLMLQSDPDIKLLAPKSRMGEIAKKWKDIPDEQKTKYEEKVKELRDLYKLEFASYLEGLSPDEREKELQKTQPKRKSLAGAKEKSPEKEKPPKKKSTKFASSSSKNNETVIELYKGEPEPPPVRVYDLFLHTFLKEKPPGTTESTRLKEAPRYWEVLPEDKKEEYREKLHHLKNQYILDYEVFLKGLSPEELKEFSLLKTKAKKMEEAQEQMERMNGTLTDSNEDSEEEDVNKNESSSESDSDDSDSGKSSKSSSSSESE